MNPEIIISFAAIAVLSIVSWILGWHYGARSLRSRHKKLIRLMEENNKAAKERNKITGNNWYDGFSTGVSTTLTAFEVFLDKFKE